MVRITACALWPLKLGTALRSMMEFCVLCLPVPAVVISCHGRLVGLQHLPCAWKTLPVRIFLLPTTVLVLQAPSLHMKNTVSHNLSPTCYTAPSKYHKHLPCTSETLPVRLFVLHAVLHILVLQAFFAVQERNVQVYLCGEGISSCMANKLPIKAC